MITRRATETEFKRPTTDEYLQGGYGLDRDQAEELAAQGPNGFDCTGEEVFNYGRETTTD